MKGVPHTRYWMSQIANSPECLQLLCESTIRLCLRNLKWVFPVMSQISTVDILNTGHTLWFCIIWYEIQCSMKYSFGIFVNLLCSLGRFLLAPIHLWKGRLKNWLNTSKRLLALQSIHGLTLQGNGLWNICQRRRDLQTALRSE